MHPEDGLQMAAENKFDAYLMLLSADWFLPYWEAVGLIFNPKQKILIQRSAQETVSDFMREADVYWHISFDEVRLEKTKSNFIGRLKKGGMQAIDVDRLIGIFENAGGSESHQAETTIWLFSMISE